MHAHISFRAIALALVLCTSLMIGCGPATNAAAPVAASTAPATTPIPASSATTDDSDRARAALAAYLDALHSRQYATAATYYSGSYELLTGYNPDIASDDHVQLLERACTANGFQCLSVAQIVPDRVISPTQFGFLVEFANADGTPFVFTPPPGAIGHPRARFQFTVVNEDGSFRVLELPPYVS